MSTPRYLIYQALQDIGAESAISPSDPTHYTAGLQILQNQLEQWAVENIPTADIFPTEIDTEMDEPAYARQAMVDSLKLRLAQKLQSLTSINPVELQNMRLEASQSMRVLRNQSRQPKKKDWPAGYPRGTGHCSNWW